MVIAMLCSLPIIIVPSVQSRKAFDVLDPNDINGSFPEFFKLYRKDFKAFGIMSGIYFLVLAAILLVMFWRIFALIDNGEKL